jgi:Family 4 glycosyl hydrolase
VPKITMIGAGSVVFTLNLLGDILSFPELAGSKIALESHSNNMTIRGRILWSSLLRYTFLVRICSLFIFLLRLVSDLFRDPLELDLNAA